MRTPIPPQLTGPSPRVPWRRTALKYIWWASVTVALAPTTAQARPPTLVSSPSEAKLNRVESVSVRKSGRVIVIRFKKPPSYSLFKRTAPYRLLLDIADSSLSPELPSVVEGDGHVVAVTTSDFLDGTRNVSRIEVALAEVAPHHIRVSGRNIILSIRSPRTSTPNLSYTAESTPSLANLDSNSNSVINPNRKAKAHTPLTKVGRLKFRDQTGSGSLIAPISGPLLDKTAIHVESMSSPPRVVLDLEGTQISPKWQRLRMGKYGLQRARVASHSGGTRIVLDGEEATPLPKVSVETTNQKLVINIAPVSASSPNIALDPGITNSPKAAPILSSVARPSLAAATLKSPSPIEHRVKDIRFEPLDGFYRLTIEFDKSTQSLNIRESKSKSSPAVYLDGVYLPNSLERTMDVSALAGTVLTSISSYNSQGQLALVAKVLKDTEHRHWRKGNRFMWDFRSLTPQVLSYEADSTAASYASTAASTAGRLTPQRTRYTGRRISLDLKDADIQNVLRLLADVSKLNIVATDNVNGRITIKLRNVPWDQALDIILSANQLDKVRNGNIIRVAPLEVFKEEEKLRLERAKKKVLLEPLTVRLIPVSYAVASDVAPQVRALLTERGSVSIDTRTNVLIVEDINDVLVKVERLVRTLDTQTPQVLIEARIVEARSNFSRELGIQWGGNAEFSQNFGNQTGLGFPSNFRVAGGADDTANQVTEGVLPNANYAVNLPAAVGSGGGGALGFVFGSVDGGTLINLRLSAAEATGKIKIVSAPKVVTLDNKQATILSGEQVPITVITANGPITRYINANIELKVLPHVTQDGSILMQIDAKKNELSDRVDFLGVPGILTKEAQTQMIVRDGDTAVLGGLYRRNTQENEAYVPWLGKIPILGWLFKTTSRSDARDELLIFISPRIVNRSEALIAPE